MISNARQFICRRQLFPRRVFLRSIALLGGFLWFTAALAAQEPGVEDVPGFRERAVVMHMVSRIVEQNQRVVWNEESTKITIPGRPVGLRLVGSDLVVAVQFTPILRATGQHILIVQGQTWINVPNEGVNYRTWIQTIPLQFNEQVYFFPLGSMKGKDESHIEIQLMLEPYSETPPSVNTSGNRNRGNNSPP
jgi:hypothetical protein